MVYLWKGDYMEEHKKDFYSIKEFAKLLGVHPNTIRRSVKNGRIGALKVGNRFRPLYRIPATEINRIALFNMEDIIEKIIVKRMEK